MPGEDPADELLHLVLLGQEAARGVGDGHRVVTDLEDGDGPDREADALLGDAVLGDLRLAEREGQHPRFLLDRKDEAPVAGDDPELRVLRLPSRTRYEHRLVGGGNVPEQHERTPVRRHFSAQDGSRSTTTVRAETASTTTTRTSLPIDVADHAV